MQNLNNNRIIISDSCYRHVNNSAAIVSRVIDEPILCRTNTKPHTHIVDVTSEFLRTIQFLDQIPSET